MLKTVQRGGLILGRPPQRQTHMRMAKIRRNQYFRHRSLADPGVRQLISDEFIQLLAKILRDPFVAMCGHICTIADVNLRLGLWCVALASTAAVGQPSVNVYSEFARIDASGQVTSPETPREILSPALVRNGFTSFQVVVEAPPDKEWWLFVGENPENVLKVTLYRETATALEPVEMPRKSSGTEVLWMDVWTPADAPIMRVKIEPELYIDDDWVTYPMEGRVMQATVQPGNFAMLGNLCPRVDRTPPPPMAEFQYRNGEQDYLLAVPLPQEERKKLLELCDDPPPERYSEDYLRIRDYLFRLR